MRQQPGTNSHVNEKFLQKKRTLVVRRFDDKSQPKRADVCVIQQINSDVIVYAWARSILTGDRHDLPHDRPMESNIKFAYPIVW